MGDDVSHMDLAPVVFHLDDQPVLVAADIENDSVPAQETGAPENRLYIFGTFVGRPLDDTVPRV